MLSASGAPARQHASADKEEYEGTDGLVIRAIFASKGKIKKKNIDRKTEKSVFMNNDTGGHMRIRKVVTITIDKETHEKAVKLLKESGINFSSFIEVMMKGLLDSQEKPMKDMVEDMTETLIKEAMKKTKRRK